jgi:hypothetical protein
MCRRSKKYKKSFLNQGAMSARSIIGKKVEEKEEKKEEQPR